MPAPKAVIKKHEVMGRLNDEQARQLAAALKNEMRRRNKIVYEGPLLVEAAFGTAPTIPFMALTDEEQQQQDRRGEGGDRRVPSVASR